MTRLLKYARVFDEQQLIEHHYSSVLDRIRAFREDLVNEDKARKKGRGGKVIKLRSRSKSSPKDAKRSGKRKPTGGGGSQHSPFKNYPTLGPTDVHQTPPAPPEPSKTRIHRQRRKWSCSNKDTRGHQLPKYQQRCISIKGKKRVLNIKINPRYKRKYNRAFKRHRTKMRAKGVKRYMPKKKAA